MIEWILILGLSGDSRTPVVIGGFASAKECQTARAAVVADNRYAVTVSACVLRTGLKAAPTKVE